jgi:transcriptional regulator with XRE-family HTH domain
MIDFKLIGEKIKNIRNEKKITQEELAEKFYISSKTVSRWETGSRVPDLTTLVELAEFYEVDIRELIYGEHQTGPLDNISNDTLKKVAEYATEESNKRKERLRTMLAGSTCLMLISYLLFGSEHKGRLNGIIPGAICGDIMSFVCGLAVASLVLYALHCLGAFDKIGQWKKNRKSRKH